MTSRKSVLLVGNYPPPFGGVPSHLEELARHLGDEGHHVHVLSPKYKDIDDPQPHANVHLHAMEPRSRLGQFRDLLSFARSQPGVLGSKLSRSEVYRLAHLYSRIERLIVEQAIDVVSAYHVLPSGYAATLAANRHAVPCAVTLFGEVYSDPELFLNRALITDYTLRNASAVWSVSKHCAEGARVRGYQVEVTYFGVSMSRFTGELSPESPGGLRSMSGPVVGYVARMEEEMGLGVLLEAAPRIFDALPGSQLLIAGRRGTLTAQAQRFADLHPLRVQVFVDPPNQTIADVYAASTVVAVPSTNERACLGLAIAEASASRRPVVVSDVGGGREILGPGAGKLVEPENPEALAVALLDYLANPVLSAQAGLAGRAFIEESFDQESRNGEIAQKICALSEKLLFS